MGITAFSATLIDKVIAISNPKNVIEMGAQNLYFGVLNGAYADVHYNVRGIEYACVDLSKENNCLVVDLSKPQKWEKQYDLVTNFGTSEHVGDNGKFGIGAFYNCWKNMHDLCKVDGIILSENPKTGSWPLHGFFYVNKDFYTNLAKATGYELIEMGEHAAMGNTVDGWNVWSILRKKRDEFISLKEFEKCGVHSS